MGGVGATFGVTYLLHKSDKLARLASKIEHTYIHTYIIHTDITLILNKYKMTIKFH